MYDFFTLELKSTHSLREQSFYRCRMDRHALKLKSSRSIGRIGGKRTERLP